MTNTQHTTQPEHKTHVRTFTRVGTDIIITETASDRMFAIQQGDVVLVNYSEIDDFIEVLQAFKTAIKD